MLTYMAPGHAWHWEQLDTTAAWNTRAGPQLQWLGASSRYLLFNDLRCGAVGDAGSAGLAAAAVKVSQAPQGAACPNSHAAPFRRALNSAYQDIDM
jgi:hypothetical protein